MRAFAEELTPANHESASKVRVFLEGRLPNSVSDPVPALAAALKLKPGVLYFATDGADFPDSEAVIKVFHLLNADHKTEVNTLLLAHSKQDQEATQDQETIMRSIAEKNGGTFRWVLLDELADTQPSLH